MKFTHLLWLSSWLFRLLLHLTLTTQFCLHCACWCSFLQLRVPSFTFLPLLPSFNFSSSSLFNFSSSSLFDFFLFSLRLHIPSSSVFNFFLFSLQLSLTSSSSLSNLAIWKCESCIRVLWLRPHKVNPCLWLVCELCSCVLEYTCSKKMRSNYHE